MNSTMLDNIKLLLGLETDEHDKKINYYISKISQKVLNHCNIKELPMELEGFVEDKVYAIMKASGDITTGGGSTENNGEIKSVTRGDTKIEYNVGSSSTQTSNVKVNGSTLFTDDEIKALKPFCRLRIW